MSSFALAAVNIAGSRLVLNLKSYAASVRLQSWTAPLPVATPKTDEHRENAQARAVEDCVPENGDRSFDLEMYSVQRNSQQLGTKFMR